MSHPRIEEVEDSDVEMSDPSEGDIDDFDEADILRPRNTNPRAHILNPANIPSVSSGAPGQFAPPPQNNHPTTTTNAKAYAHFHCLYPVYFDASRTRAQGRRVSAALAVPNPLAREIVNACRDLRLQTLFEPEKMHPKDWANPGRVKVAPLGAKGQGAGGSAGIKNKHQLYLLVAQHLRNNPTTEDSAVLWEQIPGGMPAPPREEEEEGGKGKMKKKAYPRPAVPRGWKVGEFLPYYSPAMTGGGVSENMFKDLMKEMGGAGGMPGGMPGGMDMASLMSAMGGGGAMPGQGEIEEGGGKKKKEKKGKGKA